MLQDSHAFSGFSVDDFDVARKFYGEVLGLKVTDEPGMGFHVNFGNGGEHFVYPKADHQPATYTVLNFPVPDIDEAVDALAAKGVVFEQYDMDQLKTDEKGIARPPKPEYGPPIAWFKDPAGNILSVLQAAK